MSTPTDSHNIEPTNEGAQIPEQEDHLNAGNTHALAHEQHPLPHAPLTLTHDQALERAERASDQLERARNDRWYPTFHIAARAGWINDPNGLCYFDGRYHAFYQHHPYGSAWGPMHWGHVSSADLVTWQRERIALAPSIPADQDGVFSGSAVEGPDGLLYVFYTGNRWLDGHADGRNEQTQCLAVSEDGLTFHKEGVIIDAPGLPNFRDPKVWRQGDTWCMVLGTTSEADRGQVHLYTSPDLRTWSFDRVLFEDPDPRVYMLECPDLFPLGGHWVLCYGPMTNARASGYAMRNGHNAGYVVGDWTLGSDFHPLTDYALSDWGSNYYAQQTFEAPDGRRIALAWMGGFTLPLAPQYSDNWSGQFTVPRELTLTEDLKLAATALPELNRLECGRNTLGTFVLDANRDRLLVDDGDAFAIDMVVDLSVTTSEQVGLRVNETSDGSYTWVAYDDLARRIVVDRRTKAGTDRGYRSAPIDMDEGDSHLRMTVLVDRGSVEVFAGRNTATLSACAFPSEGKRRTSLSSISGIISVEELTVRHFDSIYSDNGSNPRTMG